MWYWRDKNFQTLAAVRASIRDDDDLREYAAYLELREKGLRRSAFDHLNAFIAIARKWPLETKKKFVNWLMEIDRAGTPDLIPTPLFRQIVIPTLNDWAMENPSDPVPYRWRGQFVPSEEGLADFRLAIRLAPDDQLARIFFCKRVIRDLSMAAHELPSGYFGKAVEDLPLLAEADAIARAITQTGLRDNIQDRINSLRLLLESHAEFCDSGAPKTFAEWAIAHNKPYRT